MLSSIEVTNFQSLHHVHLELDRFTVVVGASSSGKSALMRSLRLLTQNQRGDSFITHGERQTVVTATTDKGSVTIKRGAENEYVVTPNDGPPKHYTKLGAAVPPEVSSFLGIPASNPINYAGQFDMPYLLNAPGGEVARVLGELTNVTVIFEAARTANKNRTQASSKLKTRIQDLTQIKQAAVDYAPLPAQLKAITAAEEHLDIARSIQQELSRIKNYQQEYNQLRTVLLSLPTITELPDLSTARQLHAQGARLQAMRIHLGKHKSVLSNLPTITELPDLTAAQETAQRLSRITSLHSTLSLAAASRRERMKDAEQAQEQIKNLNQQYTATLHAAGTCPTCHQSTKELHHHG